MKVFISWSGAYTKAAAGVLKNWLGLTLHGIEEIFYSDDVEKGRNGVNEIAKALSDSSVGIVCLTKQNIGAPWINFEAGAISKFGDANVYTLKIGTEPFDIPSANPLFRFQFTIFSKEDFFKIIESINRKLVKPLKDGQLRELYEERWPKLEREIQEISIVDDLVLSESENQLIDFRSRVWRLESDLNRSIEEYKGMQQVLMSQFLDRTKPATADEIDAWQVGHANKK